MSLAAAKTKARVPTEEAGAQRRHQRPDATKVAGRRDWERRGRTLNPDAKPIYILAPGGGRRFIAVCLFDLRDTDGPALKVNGWTLKGRSRVLQKVEGAAALLGVTLREEPPRGGVLGTTSAGKVVTVAAGLAPAERTATLGRRIDEAEAEGIAWIVSKALGVRSKALEYLAHLGITPPELQRSFRRIALTARDILAAAHGKRPKARPLTADEQQEPVRQ